MTERKLIYKCTACGRIHESKFRCCQWCAKPLICLDEKGNVVGETKKKRRP